MTATLSPGARITNTAALRRVPVQGRSVARVQRMLDACAAIVDEVGYEGLTTTLLAERAGVAIGSVYQFFPDKRAVVQALAERNLAAYLQRLSERLQAVELTDWWQGMDTAIDEYIDMRRTVAGFRTVHLSDGVDAYLLDPERPNNTVIAGQLADVLFARFGVPDMPHLRFAITIAVEAANALITLAFQRAALGDDEILTEAKTLIREYLHRRC